MATDPKTEPTNDNIKITTMISLTDLAIGLGIDEGALIERLGDVLLERDSKHAIATAEEPGHE